MEDAAKLIFQSISSIYDSTISSSALQSQICFKSLGKFSSYYGIRLNDTVIPDRLIIRLVDNKKEIYVDLLWLINSPDFVIHNCSVFSLAKKDIQCSSNSKETKKILEKDAPIRACYDDLTKAEGVFKTVLIGSRYCYFQKVIDEIGLEINKLPTTSFAISRSVLNKKLLHNVKYRDLAINSFIAIIDIVHRSFELLNSHLKVNNKEGEAFCIRCGYKIPSSSYFCPFCGAKQ